MTYRATPLENGHSPAQLILGRNIQTGLLPNKRKNDRGIQGERRQS